MLESSWMFFNSDFVDGLVQLVPQNRSKRLVLGHKFRLFLLDYFKLV